jgi:hypothetical protein
LEIAELRLRFLVGEYDPFATAMLNVKQSYVNSWLQKGNGLRKHPAQEGFGAQKARGVRVARVP